MRKLIVTAIILVAAINLVTAQLTRSNGLTGGFADSLAAQKANSVAGKKNITTRPFPAATTFTPSPALQRAFNWWLAIKPTEFGYTYDKVPQRQSFYDSAIY